MTVLVDFGGGGGSTFPPKGTMVPNFEDTFERSDNLSLGTQWATWWHQVDSLSVIDGQWSPPPLGTSARPGSYTSTVNPTIRDQSCIWTSPGYGIGWSSAAPIPLSWMTQGFFDQYSEMECSYVDPNAGAGMWTLVCHTMNPGSGLFEYGAYGIGFGAGTGEIRFAVLLLFTWGLTPSAFVGFPTAGLLYTNLGAFNLPADVTGPSVPTTMRLEARRVNDAWNLNAFIGGIPCVETITNNILGQGCPGQMFDQIVEDVAYIPGPANTLAIVNNFKGGWLR